MPVVLFNGIEIMPNSTNANVLISASGNIRFVFQSFNLIDELTVLRKRGIAP